MVTDGIRGVGWAKRLPKGSSLCGGRDHRCRVSGRLRYLGSGVGWDLRGNIGNSDVLRGIMRG
jgi:hypothetical protein